MERRKEYTYQGFVFTSEEELTEAKKEAEVVAYIRSQADLGNVKTVVKLYNRLIEKGTLVTTLGIAFLQELRSRALDTGTVAESSLKPLPVPVKKEPVRMNLSMTKERKLLEFYKEKTRRLTFTVAVLCIVIVILFAIRLFGTASPFADHEQKVLDKYAGWKEELTEQEVRLHMWEESLAEWEEALLQKEQELQ